MMTMGLDAKLEIMRIYPDIAAFSMRAFYEKDLEVSGEIQKRFSHLSALSIHSIQTKIDTSVFRPGLDFNMIMQQMYLAAEGYLWEITQKENMDFDTIERDFRKLIDFWKTAFCKDI